MLIRLSSCLRLCAALICSCPTLREAAKDVLPYVSPSLQSIAHKGDKDDPIAIASQLSETDIARRIAFVLDQALRNRQK